jgi:glutamine amidotransferase
MIGIVNYGMGNLASVKNSLDFLNIKAKIINSPEELRKVDKILLPGVGAYGIAIENLNNLGFSDTLRELIIDKKKPVLGICLGMQLLLDSSTEYGRHAGLCIVKGHVLPFNEVVSDLAIPHMGWNEVNYSAQSRLFSGIKTGSTFYFVHSYYCKLVNYAHVAGITGYGIDFHSALENEHIFGCQFHPEKSQKSGLCVFENFNSL